MNKSILFVDDDVKLVQSFGRTLGNMYDVSSSITPENALAAVKKRGPFAVVVSDLRMPGMNGVELLKKIRDIEPDTVRVILTGHADLDVAMSAVNEGHVFRFLTKPCSIRDLRTALDTCLEQHRLLTAEKEFLRGTLRGVVKVLTSILSAINPEAFGRCERIRSHMRTMAAGLGLPDAWRMDLAAMLSHIGCVSLPPSIFPKMFTGQEFTPEEQEAFAGHPAYAASLLAHIPRLEDVAGIIARQQERFVEGGDQPVGARLLKVALDYDTLERRGGRPADILALMDKRAWYDPAALNALRQVLIAQPDQSLDRVRIVELREGMVLEDNLIARNGMLMAIKGQTLDKPVLLKLRNTAWFDPLLVVHIRKTGTEGEARQPGPNEGDR